MTASGAREAGLSWRPAPAARTRRSGLRLAALYLISRRVPAALAAMAALAAGLRIALSWHWDSYGALQLPLVFETASAAMIAVVSASPFGEPERAVGRWLPLLRLGTTLALAACAAGALAAAGTGVHLAGGSLDVARNVAGITGLGLLCAAGLSAGMAWTGPTGYVVVGTYALYAAWHGTPASSPWLWPARPPDDLGAWLCAGLVFAAGVALTSLRGARDRPGE